MDIDDKICWGSIYIIYKYKIIIQNNKFKCNHFYFVNKLPALKPAQMVVKPHFSVQ